MDKVRSTLFPGAGGTDSESADGIPWWMKYLCKIAAILAASGIDQPLIKPYPGLSHYLFISLDVFRRLELHHDLPDVSDCWSLANHGRLHHDRDRGPLLLHVSGFCCLICRDGREESALAKSYTLYCVSLNLIIDLNILRTKW